MRKGILKRVVATLATVAMAAGLFMSPDAAMEVKAEETTLYAYGAFNNWESDGELTSTDGIVYTGEITFNTEESGIYIEATKDTWSSCVEITSVTSDDVSASVWTSDDGMSQVWIGIGDETAGTYNVSYNSSTKTLTLMLKTVSTVTYTYDYYVAGETTFEAESWSNNEPDTFGTKGKMTADGTTYTYTATTSEDFDGTDGYNIIKIGTPDDGSDKTISWLGSPFACDYTGKGTLTVTFDSEAETSTCTFVADKADSSSDSDNNNTNAGGTNTGDTSTDTNTGDLNTGNTDSTDTNVSTKNDITVEVIIDSSLAWEKVYLYAFSWDEATSKTTEYSAKWPGTKMVLKDGKYVATINTTAETVSYQITNGTDQTWDMKDIKATNGKVSFTMSGKKDSYGKYEIVLSENATTTEKEETVAVAVDKAEIDKMTATVAGAAEGATITLATIGDDEVKKVEAFKTTTLKGMKFQAMDIKLMKGTEVIAEPGATVTVKVTVPESLKSVKAVKVFRLDGEKLIEVKVVEFKDGMVSFETDHFSTYVFAEAKAATTTADMTSVAMMFAVAAMAGIVVIAMKKRKVNA